MRCVACVQGRGGSSHTRLSNFRLCTVDGNVRRVELESGCSQFIFGQSQPHPHGHVCLGVWKGRKQPNRPRLCQLHGEEVGMFMRQRRHPGPRAFLSCTLFCFADGSRGRGDLLHIEGQRLLSNCRCVMSFGVHLQKVIVIILLLLICV